MTDERQRASTALELFLRPLLRLNEDETMRLMELLEAFVDTRAEHEASDRLDREFNRGVYRY